MKQMNKSESKEILKQIHVGDVRSLENFHKSHPDVHWKDIRYATTGDTILHVAARLGHTAIVRFCLDNYPNKCIDCRNNDNKTALHEAAQFARNESATLLLQRGADVNALKKADWTPLMLACTKIQSDSIDTVLTLIRNGARLNHCNKDGWTALHLICREGACEILKILVEHGLDLYSSTKNKRTALHVAVLHGNLHLLPYLQISDIDCKDSCGNTALHEAVLSCNLAAFKILLGFGADLFAVNNCGYTVLHLAASVGALELIETVADKFDVNVCAIGGVSALHCAARNGERDTFDMLVKYGCDLNLRDSHNRTPCDYLHAQ